MKYQIIKYLKKYLKNYIFLLTLLFSKKLNHILKIS